MGATPSLLSKCESLHRLGIRFALNVGDRVARGYADLGAEEFVLVGAASLVSLFTGKVSEFPADHQKFFFRIPTVQELVDEILRRGGIFEHVTFHEQREWNVQVDLGQDASSSRLPLVSDPCFESALIEVLLHIAQRQPRICGSDSSDERARPAAGLRTERL